MIYLLRKLNKNNINMAFCQVQCTILLVVITCCTATIDEKLSNSASKCQFGKSIRKQIDVLPLNGVCLRDMVVHLSKNLHSLSNDELGVTKFQTILDKLDFVDSISTLNSKLNDLTKNLNDKLKRYTDLLRDSNGIIQPILLKQSQDIYSSGQQMDSTNRPSDICSKITDALAMNLRNQDWKNLHILPVSQPGTMCGPPSLAHNIGPLLLAQCNRSKNVILLLEHSAAFMSEEDVTLAQITAKTIVHMLLETDRVTVVGLVGGGSRLCPDQGLARATDIHKIRLDRHIDSLIRSTANQTFGLDIGSIVKDVTGEVLLIHLTNDIRDLSNINHIVETIKNKQLSVHSRTILILSRQQPHVNIKEYSMNGSIIMLPTQHVLGYEIARLFTGLKCNKDDVKPYYLSDPYFEPYSKAMMVSIGQITNTALLSFDVKLRDFVEEVTYFDAGNQRMHALLVDKRGMLWMHKDFPRMETIVEQPLKVYLHDIENLDRKTIGKIGMDEQAEGMAEVKSLLGLRKQLHWRQLNYPELIACLVVIHPDEGETRQPQVRVAPALPTDILHHRLDLALGPSARRERLCIHNNNRVATLDTGVIYLSPWCFKSPAEQAKQFETAPAVTVQSYMAYIKDVTRLLTNPGMRENVKTDVAVLAQILDHFKERHADSPLNKFIVQRYVTSVGSGVLEVYPGLVLDSDLDPKRRAWYTKALQQPGRIVMSPPYLDAGGSGFVVSLSQVVHEGRSVGLHSNTDPVVAVMAMDLTLGYFSRMLDSMFPLLCAEPNIKCFLMDDRGYLVFHPSLLQASSKIEQQHLTNKELLVANDILNHDFLVKKKMCSSHMDGTTQRYYQFNISLDEVLTNIVHGEHCVMYQLAVVPGTNIFLGVVNITCNSLNAFCPCSTMDRSCLNCKRMEQTDCECPCECSLYSSECQLEESVGSDIEPCPAPQEQGSSLASPWIQPVDTGLKLCQSFSCKSYITSTECLGIAGCQWCEIDSDGETSLQQPYCADMATCFRGVFGSPIPYGDGSYNSQSTEEIMSKEWPSVGPVAGGILAFVLVLGVALFCYRLRSVHTGLEHQCLHNHNSPDTLRMTHLDCDVEPADLEREPKASMDSALLRDIVAPISPYRVSTNYRRPPGGDSDHGYSTMTPHDDSEQQNFSEPLLVLAGNVSGSGIVPSTSSTILDSPATSSSTTGTIVAPPSPTTNLGSPHRVVAAVTVHRDMETNYC
ncbi:PREDICTED: VWFA and cache domain-containing protein 1 [Ceratosolen solmsi marchali]|uniref:VWFA and cache domain-containing protein 1 n=1 Tax=Ceratosolen solmsi marchali TaxID=326594 RepID=A0AAJ7DWJ2_9HYME|nr:PREDICTED: VWFA and cache domain-containing protein 1 [Ceratosolen solmsi marchali]